MTDTTNTTLNVVSLPGGMKTITIQTGANIREALSEAQATLGFSIEGREVRLGDAPLSDDAVATGESGVVTVTDKVAGA